MSISLNRLTIAGNLTREVETRTAGDRQVANFTIANNRRWKDRDGGTREEATFIECEAWGRNAEIAAQYLGKGRPVILEGRLKQDSWTDPATNQKRSKFKVVVELLHLVGGRPQGSGEGDADRDDEFDEGAAGGAFAPVAATPGPGRPASSAPARPVRRVSAPQPEVDAPF